MTSADCPPLVALGRAAATPASATEAPPSAEYTDAQAALESLGGDHSVPAERQLALLSQAERMRLALLTLARLRTRMERQHPGDAAARDGSVAIVSSAQPARPSRILVVEAESTYRRLLDKALTRAGWTTHTIDSADEAVAAFERNSYAMAVVGTDGLRLDGYDVARRMRQSEKPATRTPIIALTGDVLQSDRKKRKAAGFDNYIAKPIRLSPLENMLVRYTRLEAPPEEPLRQLLAIDERCISDLLELVGGNADQFKEFIEECLAEVAELTNTMRRAEEDQAFNSLWEAARTLRSVSAQIGAGSIRSICTTIEALAKAGSAAGVDSLLQELSLANERVQRELRSLRPRLNRPSRQETRLPAAPGEVLVAESDALTARFLITVLTNGGFKVTHSSEGNGALAQITAKAFQLIIVNSALAGMDGFGVLSQSRLLPQHALTPVIMLSSRRADQDVVRAFDLGADDHISVPFNPMEVLARILRLLRVK